MEISMQVQIVGKSLKYGIRRYHDGQRADMTDKHARLFIALGRARIPKAPRPDIPASPSLPVTVVTTTEVTQPQPGVEAEEQLPQGTEDSEPRARRRYARRDMRSEP